MVLVMMLLVVMMVVIISIMEFWTQPQGVSVICPSSK